MAFARARARRPLKARVIVVPSGQTGYHGGDRSPQRLLVARVRAAPGAAQERRARLHQGGPVVRSRSATSVGPAHPARCHERDERAAAHRGQRERTKRAVLVGTAPRSPVSSGGPPPRPPAGTERRGRPAAPEPPPRAWSPCTTPGTQRTAGRGPPRTWGRPKRPELTAAGRVARARPRPWRRSRRRPTSVRPRPPRRGRVPRWLEGRDVRRDANQGRRRARPARRG